MNVPTTVIQGVGQYKPGLVDISPSLFAKPEEQKVIAPANIEVTAIEAKKMLEKEPKGVLLDVREDDEYLAGHAKMCQLLPMSILEKELRRRFPDKNQLIIMYCRSGNRSYMTSQSAISMGYTRVHSLIGGFRALAMAGFDCTGR